MPEGVVGVDAPLPAMEEEEEEEEEGWEADEGDAMGNGDDTQAQAKPPGKRGYTKLGGYSAERKIKHNRALARARMARCRDKKKRARDGSPEQAFEEES